MSAPAAASLPPTTSGVESNSPVSSTNAQTNQTTKPVSWLAHSVKWLRAEGESNLIQIAKKILAYVLAAFLAITVIGVVVVVDAVREWKHQDRVAAKKAEADAKKAEADAKKAEELAKAAQEAAEAAAKAASAKLDLDFAEEELKIAEAKVESLKEALKDPGHAPELDAELEEAEKKLGEADYKVEQAELLLADLLAKTQAEEHTSSSKFSSVAPLFKQQYPASASKPADPATDDESDSDSDSSIGGKVPAVIVSGAGAQVDTSKAVDTKAVKLAKGILPPPTEGFTPSDELMLNALAALAKKKEAEEALKDAPAGLGQASAVGFSAAAAAMGGAEDKTEPTEEQKAKIVAALQGGYTNIAALQEGLKIEAAEKAAKEAKAKLEAAAPVASVPLQIAVDEINVAYDAYQSKFPVFAKVAKEDPAAAAKKAEEEAAAKAAKEAADLAALVGHNTLAAAQANPPQPSDAQVKGAAAAKKMSAADIKAFFEKRTTIVSGQQGSKTTDDLVVTKTESYGHFPNQEY